MPLIPQLGDGGRPERGDPVEAFDLADLVDLDLRQDPPVRHQDHANQTKALPQLLDLDRKRVRIGRVALKDLDGHRASVGGAQEPVDDLREALLPVPVVAIAGQVTMLSRVVARGDVVEHQGAILKVRLGQGGLDGLLTGQKGIHGPIQLVFGRPGHSQHLSESRGGRLGGESPGEGELRAWREWPVGDQGFLEIPRPASPGSEKGGESRGPHCSDDGRHVAMRQGANADHVLGENSHGLAGHSGLHDLEDVGRKMGEVRQCLVLDLPVFAMGPAEKCCGVDLLSNHPLCCDHMTGSISASHE